MGYKEKIQADTFTQIMEQNIKHLDDLAEKMKLGYVSVFAGAGLSVASGYVDWRKLLEPIRNQLRLDTNVDLTELAHYYDNQYVRLGLNNTIFNEFSKVPKNNKNVEWLTKLPIREYWTTNYDDIIESELVRRGKVVDTVVNQESFKYHNPRCEVVVYKMHGDKKYPDDVVLTKKDYHEYDEKRPLFTKLLSVELIRRTFLFIGFSFNDPNLERIISMSKNMLNSKLLSSHYCFMRKVQLWDYLNEQNKLTEESVDKYIQDRNYQKFRIDDMAKSGIFTILVDDFEQITLMLQYLYNKYISNNVFISGGINPDDLSNYGSFYPKVLHTSKLSPPEEFLTSLGKKLVDNGFEIYTGFGAGVGNYILSGVLSSNRRNPLNADITKTDMHISSLLGVENELKDEIRTRLIEQCSSILILFGYNEHAELESGNMQEGEATDTVSTGIHLEYEIAKKLEEFIVPVQQTGFEAKRIYDEMVKRGELNEDLKNFLAKENSVEDLVDGIIDVLKQHRVQHEQKLSDQLVASIAKYGIGVFISYHYRRDHEIARQITNIINQDKLGIFTAVRENEKGTDPEVVKNWVCEEIQKTKITILLISRETLGREYVSYELSLSKKNGNTIITVIIDSDENHFSDDEIQTISKKLQKDFSINSKVRRWFADNGPDNLLEWLNDAVNSSLDHDTVPPAFP